ncbi:MAG: radical SAM protein [Planctomycetes bacterium]|nr:radical SAM protein [Planctomycetota bacterium]
MAYEIHNGRISTWSLEAHLVNHCNLRCVHCCTLSPRLAHSVLEPAVLDRDLRALAPVLAPQVLKLTGGEPLLHPAIVACLHAARESALAPVVQVTTNGFLAPRMEPAFWRLVQRLSVSLYPSAPLPDATLGLILERCEQNGVELRLKPAPRFSVMDADPPHDDPAVFESCWLRHRCHMAWRGRFFLCTRPPHLAETLGNPALLEDGIPLHEPELQQRLLDCLQRTAPLSGCRWCLGATGEMQPHRQHERAPASGPVAG